MSGRVWPDSVRTAVAEAIYTAHDPTQWLSTVDGTANAESYHLATAALDALAVDAEGEVARLRESVTYLDGRVDRADNATSAALARADAAETRLAEVWDEGWQAQEDYADGDYSASTNPYRTDSTETVTPADEAVES